MVIGNKNIGVKFGLILSFAFLVLSSTILSFVSPVVSKSDSSSLSSTPLPTISTVPIAPSTISQDGKDGDFTTQAAVGSLTARLTNNIAETNSFYDVVFVTTTAGPIKKIDVTFPFGTTVPASAFFNEAEGIGPGTASKSGLTITYTVTNAVNVPAGTKIRLEFANIINPTTPSTNLKVTVTTKTATNIIIDGPTQSTAYTIKQIGFETVRRNGPAQSVGPGETKSSIAVCEPGEELLSGGWETTFADGTTVTRYDGKPIGDNDQDERWEVQRHNMGNVASNFYAIAMCAPSGLS
jgi:hypothetical protein